MLARAWVGWPAATVSLTKVSATLMGWTCTVPLIGADGCASATGVVSRSTTRLAAVDARRFMIGAGC
jgi:hypothetical protein